ncbi:MAG: HNH endonuclease [Actinobacteria bacterium]|nr:HNH endonuclease [Actinomycetota bacterium]
MSTVLVLNAGYEPLHRVSVRHAIRMLVREVAVVEEADPGRQMGPFPVPRVLRLVRYVQMRWRSRAIPAWTRDALFRRDGRRCVYCDRRDVVLTVDHVVPRSQGGRTTWTNTVAACGGPEGCNARKADRTPEQAGMRLRRAPHVPSFWELIA